MSRKMLLLFVASVFSMVGVLHSQCDEATPICPERISVAYEILLAEVKSDHGIDLNHPAIIRRNSEGSKNCGFGLLSNIETYFLTEFLTRDEWFGTLCYFVRA